MWEELRLSGNDIYKTGEKKSAFNKHQEVSFIISSYTNIY